MKDILSKMMRVTENEETEARYKSDADIAGEFANMKILGVEVTPSRDADVEWVSGYIEVEFPEGGEHVGGGTDYVNDRWIKYDKNKPGKIAFDNWYPEDVYNQLAAAVEAELAGGGVAEAKDDNYGNKRDHRKIDIYVDGKYEASTNWAKNLKIAKEKYLEKEGKDMDASKVVTRYAE